MPIAPALALLALTGSGAVAATGSPPAAVARIAPEVAPPAGLPSLPWEAWLDPWQLPRLLPGDQVLLRSSHCPDGCRFDRSSEGDPRFLRVEDGEAIVFDEPGAGAIVRIWATMGPGVSEPIDPAIRIRFRFDGERTPRLDLPLAALFDGSTPPFLPPLVADRLHSSGGNVSSVPIPYARGCVVSLLGAERARIWFQFTFHRLSQPGRIETFTGHEDLSAWRDLLGRAGGEVWPRGAGRSSAGTARLDRGRTLRLDATSGAGFLRRIRLRTSVRGAERVRLRLRFDGALRVDLPLADFFAARGAQVAPRGLLVGRGEDGFLDAWFPMPFFRDASVELTDGAPTARPVRVEWRLDWSDAQPAADSGLFGATSTVAAETTPDGTDLPLLSISGRGKWIGLFAEISSVRTPSREVLEGDERVYLDGSRHPGLYGTGVEDLFNGGFYFDRGPFALPGHGATAHRVTAANEDATAMYRLFLSDAVPFRSGIAAGLETGPTGNLPLRARTVAWYYSRPEPALVEVDRVDVADPTSRQSHDFAWNGADDLACSTVESRFEGGPLVAPGETLGVCSFAAPGSERFTLDRPRAAGALRLRRRFDAERASGAADVFLDGVWVGTFPAGEANSARRFREVDLDVPPRAGRDASHLRFEVVPRSRATPHATIVYALLASP